MPKRKGIVLNESHVRGVRLSPKMNVGETNTIRMMEELGRKVDFASGKIYIRRGSLGEGKERAQRAFFKPLFGPNEDSQRSEGARAVRVMNTLRARGLPVPKAGIVEHQGQLYLAMSPFIRKGGSISKITPINTTPGSHTPHFLGLLNAAKNAELIRSLGRDTAEIINSGMYTKYFDFFGFYKKRDGSVDRIIMDVDYFYDMQGRTNQKGAISSLFRDIKSVWKPKRSAAELALFSSAMKERLESQELRQAVDEALAEKRRSFWSYVGEIFSG